MPFLTFLNFNFKQFFPGPVFRVQFLSVLVWFWKCEVDHSSLLHHDLVKLFLYLFDFRMVLNIIFVFVL